MYYIWSFFFLTVFYFRNILEFIFIKINHTNIFYKNNFYNLNIFEKYFLSLFFKKNLFNFFFKNKFQHKLISNFRYVNQPMISFFHFFSDRVEFKFLNLNFLIKNYFFINSLNTLYFKNFKLLNNSFLMFLIVQHILFKKYYNLYNSLYFKSFSIYNIIKLNYLFIKIIFTSNLQKLHIYNLNVFNDWYQYNFNRNFRLFNKNKQIFFNFKKEKYHEKIKNVYSKYNKILTLFSKFLKKPYKNIQFFNYNYLNLRINLNKNWLKILINNYKIKFSESSISKHINLNSIKNYNFLYLRKNKIFNKSRYSRNRQLYRTGVYWCLWLNVIVVYGLFFVFYRFTFNFGYFWWGILFLIYSTIFSKVLKYNFHNIFNILIELKNLIYWYGFIFYDLLNLLNFLIFFLFKKINFFNYLFSFFELNNLFFKNNFFIINNYFKFFKKIELNKFDFFWEGMKFEDKSFLRYKTLFHWLKQSYKVLTK